MVYVGIYALIYLHTILGEGVVSRDGLPRGVLPSGILKIEKYCPGLKVPVSKLRAIGDVGYRQISVCVQYSGQTSMLSCILREHGHINNTYTG